MISKNAVEAFKRFYRDRGVYLNHGLDCHLSDALSAALPLLLEGKREEIAREISGAPFPSKRSLAKADRIVAMLGGGDVG